jgi:hypothetical protein
MQNEGQVRLHWIEWIVLAVVIVGAINWRLVGAAHFLTDGANGITHLSLGTDCQAGPRTRGVPFRSPHRPVRTRVRRKIPVVGIEMR